tara:strand:- start:1132 stop:1248 length:117 start_codon:yes stop_codon:yes gene_type:complete
MVVGVKVEQMEVEMAVTVKVEMVVTVEVEMVVVNMEAV